MLKILFAFLFFVTSHSHGQNTAQVGGLWSGEISENGNEFHIDITFSSGGSGLDGTIDIPRRGLYNLPVEVIFFENDSLVFQYQTGRGAAVFYGSRSDAGRTIEGRFERAGETFPFYLSKAGDSGTDGHREEEELIISTENGRIAGSLILAEKPAPFVVLVSGGGITDRNKTVAGFEVFGELAGELFERGYSSFRYDSPGNGESEGTSDATLEELAGVVEEVVSYLKNRYPEHTEDLVLLGHNRGGLVASMAARHTTVDGLIFFGSPFLRGDEMIRQQILLIAGEKEVPDDIVQTNLAFQEKVFRAARNESGWDEIEAELAGRLGEQISRLPDEQRATLGDMSGFIRSEVERQLATAKSRWFRSMISAEPAGLLKGLELPMLALFGEKDREVPAEENAGTSEELASRLNLDLTTIVIPEANHLFQQAGSGMPGEYGVLDREFAGDVMDTIVTWLKSVTG